MAAIQIVPRCGVTVDWDRQIRIHFRFRITAIAKSSPLYAGATPDRETETQFRALVSVFTLALKIRGRVSRWCQGQWVLERGKKFLRSWSEDGVSLGGVVVGFLQVLHIIGQRPCTNAFLTMVSKYLLLGPSDILKWLSWLDFRVWVLDSIIVLISRVTCGFVQDGSME